MLGREHVVEERPLRVVEMLRPQPALGEGSREPQHVVRVAGLRALAVLHHGGEVVRIVEVLAHAVAADHGRTMLDDGTPEDICRVMDAGIRRYRVADGLRDLRVGVQPGQRVAALLQRLEDRAMREPQRHRREVVTARDHGETRERLVHPAELGREHRLEGLVIDVRGDLEPPVGQTHDDLERPLVTGDEMRVDEPLERLVQVVPGHPVGALAEGSGGRDPVDRQGGEQRSTAGHPADVAGAPGILRAGELADRIVETLPQVVLARRSPKMRQRGQVVTAGLTAQPLAFPAAVPRCPRRQPGLAQEGREQPIGLERAHVREVDLQRVGERPAVEPHAGEREELHRAPLQ